MQKSSMRRDNNCSGFNSLLCSTHETVSVTAVETPLIWRFDFTIRQRYTIYA